MTDPADLADLDQAHAEAVECLREFVEEARDLVDKVGPAATTADLAAALRDIAISTADGANVVCTALATALVELAKNGGNHD